MDNNDKKFMQQAIKLALRGEGWTLPNPMVGAVIVKNGKIIGEGYHHKVGLPHAEVEAMNTAKAASLKGATLYVNLEPCCHFGRTPPCTDLIIKSGIFRVVCSTLDPNPKLKGNGIKQLRKEGIQISVGALDDVARKLNEAFFTFHKKKRPFVAVKFAASLDGKIATSTGDSKWITGAKARDYARKLRGVYQAICVGATTIVRDNPHLGTRSNVLRDPLRVIFDPYLRTSPNSQVYRDDNTLIFCSKSSNPSKKVVFERKRIQVVSISGNPYPLDEIIRYLYKHEVASVLVEGGATTIGNFFDSKLVDKVFAFHAPLIIGGTYSLSAVGGKGVPTIVRTMKLNQVTRYQLGEDLLTEGYL